jgi:putative ABC transport system ATP-binding protein
VTSDEIMAALVRLNEGGLTVIVVTHDAEVARYARRVIHFKDGRVVSDDLNQDMRAAA